jgi:hypothetical protein
MHYKNFGRSSYVIYEVLSENTKASGLRKVPFLVILNLLYGKIPLYDKRNTLILINDGFNILTISENIIG